VKAISVSIELHKGVCVGKFDAVVKVQGEGHNTINLFIEITKT